MQFKARFPLNIRFKDFDSLGHVNNAVFLTYFEEARVKYFELVIHPDEEIDWWNDGIILASVQIDFKKPIDGYKNFFVGIGCSKIGNKSFELEYEISREEKDSSEIFATGKSVMVCYDYEKKTTVPVYEEWIQRVEKFEGRKFR